MKPAFPIRTIFLSIVLMALVVGFAARPTAAQQPAIDLDVKRAVVRIVPERCFGGSNCIAQTSQPGSGVIIHPSGLLLTAWHVLSQDDNPQQEVYWDDFVIEVIEDSDSVPPVPRFRAKIVATRPEMDLAILRIDRTLNGEPIPADSLPPLAWLPVYSGQSSQLEAGTTPLPVLGYPIPPPRTGRTTLFTNQRLTLDSHNVPDAEMWVQWRLDKGYSGGPGLVAHNDEVQVAGIVRSAVGNRTELRDLSVAFHSFVWQPGEQQLYADSVRVTQTSVNGAPYLHFDGEIHAVGRENEPLQFQISFFEAESRQPWRPGAVDLPRLSSGQVYWIADVRPDRPVYQGALQVPVPIDGIGLAPTDLVFRIKLGRADPFAQLWSDNIWYEVESPGNASTDPPSPTATRTETQTATPSPTPTPDARATLEAAVRATLTAAAPTARPTDTQTPRLPTPTNTSTPDAEALIAMAVNATLTALAPTPTDTATPTNTPTSTNTPDAAATFQAAVNATLTALAPTATPTRTPTATRTPTPTPTPTRPAAGATREIEGITFVYVPVGEFVRGSSDSEIGTAVDICNQLPYYNNNCQRDWFADESPQRTVYLDSYWMMRTEVTNAQYRRFVEADGYSTERYWTTEGWKWRGENSITLPSRWTDSDFNDPEQPVVGVSWYEAVAYASWLSEKTGLTLRLPSEAEWEKAARGADGRIYPWGDDWDGSRVNYCDVNCTNPWADGDVNDGYHFTAPVGSYANGASSYGALDMGGNVWEWVQDWYDSGYYADSPDRNPQGPASGQRRVLRGGSWHDFPAGVRAAYRSGFVPDSRFISVGFRLVAPGL